MFRLAVGIFLLAGVSNAMAFQEPECKLGTVDEIQPADAIRERITGPDAWIFGETLMDRWDAASVEAVDAVLLMSGPDVMGGNVVFLVAGNCILGYKFVTILELIHGREIVDLYQTERALAERKHLDETILAELAAAGNPVAAFHVGLVAAWGRGGKGDRAASLDWLLKSAELGYTPAVLALGMALSGPDVIHDGVEFIGQPPPTDEFTDLVRACYWLAIAAVYSPRPIVARAADHYGEMNMARMSSEEMAACKKLLGEESGP